MSFKINEEKEPIAGNFETESSLMWQLEKLTTEELASIV